MILDMWDEFNKLFEVHSDSTLRFRLCWYVFDQKIAFVGDFLLVALTGLEKVDDDLGFPWIRNHAVLLGP
jgi:hypothetical protein